MSDPATAAPYAFRQLEEPRPVSLREIEDPIANAHAEAERIREEARAQGYADGQAAALAAAQPPLEAALAALQQAVAGVEQVRDETAAAVERDAIELSLQLAEKIVAGALAVESERIVDVVRGALRRLAERRRVTILVHPDDLETVRAATESFVTGLGGIEHCEVQAERRITPGGASVRTEEGQIDATVSTQLMRARELVELELGE
ncbi:FliH/SctL family protein [Conexibacter woesei]|uniref:Flagellar assembly protein FliH/Type III secretion system HrpE n=1 Tax=Conexibacter woesei (strain DSM 14684 / CCUG 47730 / CIP 108061 / JCM 11494 / NBRC 100937 / ID131577) TaxID=469383 RepID=D3F3Z3_CONWI|nr:FliH/SctL family protein [Conexibacter woesei]ADB48476.1 Flagellar assembly protein FliH/Type III secretion system HrpE [Conexibacter woesei DSM 14684]